MYMKGFSRVSGVGGYLPENIVESETLMDEIKSETRFGMRRDWLNDVVGVEQRRVAPDGARPSDLALEAGRVAVEDAGIDGRDIDLVIYCGIDRDWCEPATAHRIQAELAPGAACFDITNACHGVMNGVMVANSMIGGGGAENVLVVTGELPSRVMKEAIRRINLSENREDFRRWLGALTVGDSGGALMVSRKQNEEQGFRSLSFHSAGKHAELCYYRDGENGLEGQMLMSEISQEIIGMHAEHINETYHHLAWSPDNIDKLVAHQVGWRPQVTLAKKARVTIDRATHTFKQFGNLVSATIPVNLWLNRPKASERVLILGTGSGLSISQSGMVF
ncbi:MAG: ketoacyl-ACP synthase III [Gammaproteobacteria bacterium]